MPQQLQTTLLQKWLVANESSKVLICLQLKKLKKQVQAEVLAVKVSSEVRFLMKWGLNYKDWHFNFLTHFLEIWLIVRARAISDLK